MGECQEARVVEIRGYDRSAFLSCNRQDFGISGALQRALRSVDGIMSIVP